MGISIQPENWGTSTPNFIDTFANSTAWDLADSLPAGQVSAMELFDAAVSRIETLDGPINAVVVRDFDRARDGAKAADVALARGDRAPLLGVPMTVKESFNVAGLPTTWGIEAAKGWIAPTDAVGVARLKAAGAVILGKTNVPPHLGDWQSVNPIYGRTTHPLNPELTPGGSSGGAAAAIAAGMVPLEFGSDIGGSIRVPASFCGIFGHKPSHDLVPLRGQSPPGTDGAGIELGVVGPLARTASDLALALSILAGPEGFDTVGYKLDLPAPRHDRLGDYRILLIDEHPVAALDDEIRDALHALVGRLETAGAKVTRQSNLLPDLAKAHDTYSTILMTTMSRGAPAFGPPVSAHEWMSALDDQYAIRKQWALLFETYDVVLAPVMGVTAFPHDDSPFNDRIHMINGIATPYGAQVAWPGMATVANLPATAMPIGTTRAGLPIGMQIIGPYLEDRMTIAFAGLIENL